MVSSAVCSNPCKLVTDDIGLLTYIASNGSSMKKVVLHTNNMTGKKKKLYLILLE